MKLRLPCLSNIPFFVNISRYQDFSNKSNFLRHPVINYYKIVFNKSEALFNLSLCNLNKTWSSVSNSNLSKTFALCQFRKLKVQKLCFLPQNVILGLKKMSPKIILGQKKILIQKKINVQIKSGLEKFLIGKNFVS